MREKKRFFVPLVLTLLMVFFMTAANVDAAPEKMSVSNPVAQEMKARHGINWMPNVDYRYLVLSVSKPDGEIIRKTFEAGSVPYFHLSDTFGQKFPDGSYTYELRVIPFVDKNTPESPQKELTQTGYFLIRGGRIVIETDPEDSLNRAFCGCYEFDDTDVVVEGKLCVGRDCLYDGDCDKETLRLKEEEVRILFMDTSTTSYPDNDWQIIINDDDTGSGEYFSIQDKTGNTRPFTIEAGAPESSVYIDNQGRVGIGTSTPGYEIEVDGTGDKCAIALNRVNGATSYINATESYGNAGTTTNHPYRIITNSLWRICFNTDNSLDMRDGGSYDGTWNDASSREYKENIRNLTLDEALDALEGLNPVKYNYKKQKEEERLGFIAEDVPELVAAKDRKVMSTMDVVAVLTKVVQKQHEDSQKQQEIIFELKEEIAKLKKKLK
jgi:hypothetical protein